MLFKLRVKYFLKFCGKISIALKAQHFVRNQLKKGLLENCTKRALSLAEETQFVFDYPGLEISESFLSSQFIGWATDTREKIFADPSSFSFGVVRFD